MSYLWVILGIISGAQNEAFEVLFYTIEWQKVLFLSKDPQNHIWNC